MNSLSYKNDSVTGSSETNGDGQSKASNWTNPKLPSLSLRNNILQKPLSLKHHVRYIFNDNSQLFFLIIHNCNLNVKCLVVVKFANYDIFYSNPFQIKFIVKFRNLIICNLHMDRIILVYYDYVQT